MEKIENKESKILKALQSEKSKYVLGTLLLTGIGIALPRIFHILAGSSAGAIFLPMHIAVLISALTFGSVSASVVALASVFCSYLLTGMPALARLPYMMVELVIYAVLLGRLNKKFNSYISLILTVVLGRVLYAGVLFVSINYLGLQTYGISVIESIKTGMPGIVMQLICVPFIAKIMNDKLGLNK